MELLVVGGDVWVVQAQDGFNSTEERMKLAFFRILAQSFYLFLGQLKEGQEMITASRNITLHFFIRTFLLYFIISSQPFSRH